MQQVWAEVFVQVKAGARFNLDSTEVAELSVHNEQFEVTDPIAERLADFFDFTGAVAWDWVTTTTALQMTGIKDPSKHDTIAAAIALKKLNGNQRYATTSRGAAHIRGIADAVEAPLQMFVSRNNMPCGSTIGPITSTRLGIEAIDIGVPQLSMHSARELCGAQDPGYLVTLMGGFLTR
jgi:aspartyl aminopeptidase